MDTQYIEHLPVRLKGKYIIEIRLSANIYFIRMLDAFVLKKNTTALISMPLTSELNGYEVNLYKNRTTNNFRFPTKYVIFFNISYVIV